MDSEIQKGHPKVSGVYKRRFASTQEWNLYSYYSTATKQWYYSSLTIVGAIENFEIDRKSDLMTFDWRGEL